MTMQVLFAGVRVRFLGAATDWYERLFGRPADIVPNEHEVMWRVADGGWLYVLQDPDRAGHSLVTIAVASLDDAVAEAAARGIEVGSIEAVGSSGRKASTEDPDGNSLAFVEVATTRNPSAPPQSVVPVLSYDDVRAAVEWLTSVLGCIERVRIDDHRAQLSFAEGAVIVADATHGRTAPEGVSSSVMLRVDDVDARYRAAVAAGARVVREPADHAYGERQCSVVDPGGQLWTFTHSVAAVQPESWGGTTVSPW